MNRPDYWRTKSAGDDADPVGILIPHLEEVAKLIPFRGAHSLSLPVSFPPYSLSITKCQPPTSKNPAILTFWSKE